MQCFSERALLAVHEHGAASVLASQQHAESNGRHAACGGILAITVIASPPHSTFCQGMKAKKDFEVQVRTILDEV
jgi:hypothetical protein